MSTRVNINDISRDHALIIREYLFMQPKEPYNPGKKYGFGDKPNKDPILFYITNDEYIDIPMAFASSLLKINSNIYIDHLKSNITFSPDKNLFDDQKDVGNIALNYLKNYGGVHLGLYPGFGKTILSTWLSCQLGYLTLVLTHRTNLIRQWVNAFTNFSNAKIWIVGNDFPTLKDGEYISTIICMNTRIDKIPEELLDKVGITIVDESHNFCTSGNISALLCSHPKYFISCSATLNRTDGMEQMIKAIVGNNEIYRHSNKPFDYVQIRNNINVPISKNVRGTTNFTKLITDLCELEIRNKLIIDLVNEYKDKKILLLTARYDHSIYLKDELTRAEKDVDYLAGKKNLYTDSDILVGTYSKIGEGFDEANACVDYNGIRLNLLILCTSFKSKNMMEQICGRVFRAKFPTVIDIVDDIKLCKTHANERRKWAISRGGKHTVRKINVKQI